MPRHPQRTPVRSTRRQQSKKRRFPSMYRRNCDSFARKLSQFSTFLALPPLPCPGQVGVLKSPERELVVPVPCRRVSRTVTSRLPVQSRAMKLTESSTIRSFKCGLRRPCSATAMLRGWPQAYHPSVRALNLDPDSLAPTGIRRLGGVCGAWTRGLSSRCPGPGASNSFNSWCRPNEIIRLCRHGSA
jgi:hypothetical protein